MIEDRRQWRIVHEGEDRRNPEGGRVVVVERPANGNGNGKHHTVAQTLGVVTTALGTVAGIVWLILEQSADIATMKTEVRDTRSLCLYGLTQLENRVQTGADIAEIRRSWMA
ncbi:MAG: hypothetical protein U1F68_14995 [Gammaproteobacteria bacterium]